MNSWKIHPSKPVFSKSNLFSVEEFRLSWKEKSKTHYIVKRRPAVTVIPVEKNYTIYLVKQYRYLLQQKTLEAMAGFVEEDETSLAAAQRELKEETGIEASAWEEISRFEIAASVIKGKQYFFLAQHLTHGEKDPEEGENIEVVKLPLKDAVSKVLTGEINNASSMVGILMLEAMRRSKKL